MKICRANSFLTSEWPAECGWIWFPRPISSAKGFSCIYRYGRGIAHQNDKVVFIKNGGLISITHAKYYLPISNAGRI